jgi:hypothetical protein
MTMRLSSTALLLLALTPAFAGPVESLPTIELTINGHRLTAEIAATEATRSTGLMRRFSLRPDHGMLFVFTAPQPLAFWMKDTYVALSIAFIAGDGRILNIDDMAPQTETTHPSHGPAMFALEMKKGWFAERAIKSGDLVQGATKAPKAKD